MNVRINQRGGSLWNLEKLFKGKRCIMRKSKGMMSKIFATAMAGLLLFSSTMFSEAAGVEGSLLGQSKDKQVYSTIAKKNVKNTKKKTTKTNKNTKPAQVKKIKRINPTFHVNAVDAKIEFILKEEGTPVKVAYDKKAHIVTLSDSKYGAKISIAPVSMNTKNSTIKIYVPNEMWSKVSLNMAQSDMVCQNIFKSGDMTVNFDQSNTTLAFAKGYNANMELNMNLSKVDVSVPDNFSKEVDVNSNQTDLKLVLPETFAGNFEGKSSISNIDFALAGGYRNSDVKISVLEGQVAVPEYFSSALTGYEHSADNEKNTIVWTIDPASVVNFAS